MRGRPRTRAHAMRSRVPGSYTRWLKIASCGPPQAHALVSGERRADSKRSTTSTAAQTTTGGSVPPVGRRDRWCTPALQLCSHVRASFERRRAGAPVATEAAARKASQRQMSASGHAGRCVALLLSAKPRSRQRVDCACGIEAAGSEAAICVSELPAGQTLCTAVHPRPW